MRYYQTLPRRKKKYTRVRAYILVALRSTYLLLTIKNIVKYIAQWQFFFHWIRSMIAAPNTVIIFTGETRRYPWGIQREWGGGGNFAKNKVFLAKWTKNSGKAKWTKNSRSLTCSCIADSLAHTTCVETNKSCKRDDACVKCMNRPHLMIYN